MSETQANLLQEQLQELVKVGVGGKYKDKENYISKIQEEIEFEEAMLRGGIDRYNKAITEARTKNRKAPQCMVFFTNKNI